MPFWLLYACVLLAVTTHPLLDWCTSYGTQLLAPVTHARFAIDAVPIVDIFYTPLLIVTLLACYLIRKFAPTRSVKATLIVGWTGMLLSVGYLGAGRAMHDMAVSRIRSLAGSGKIIAANAYPAIGSILVWRTTAEKDHEWVIARIRPLHRNNPSPPRLTTAPKMDNEWIRRTMATEDAQVYRWFAMGQIRAAYERVDGKHIVYLHDMRYAGGPDGATSYWPLRVTLDDNGQVLSVERVSSGPRGGRSKFIKQAWKDIWGG